MKNNKLILWALVLFMGLSLLQNKDPEKDPILSEGDLGVATKKTEYALGKEIKLTIQNNTQTPLSFTTGCPPFPVERYENRAWVPVTPIGTMEDCTPQPLTLEANKAGVISFKDWAYRTFGTLGRYKIVVPDPSSPDRIYSSNEFLIQERGLFGTIWIDLIYRPIQNTLVSLIKLAPSHDLGIGIILLTLLIRTILLVPSQKALKSQRKMQAVQGEIDTLKKKYKDNQEKLAIETMNLWRQHKVNPFGSCLMMLIQFPILIALYYVIQAGLSPDKIGLLYSSVANNFSLSEIQTNFFGILELTRPNFWVLPFIVGGLQFLQMHLTFKNMKKKKDGTESDNKNIAKAAEGEFDMQSQMQMANNMMKYFMPAMIAFFTASLPAGVGLYWATSTVYGIVQQWVVNRTKISLKTSEATVRVVETKETKSS